jgi:hypothetical protein
MAVRNICKITVSLNFALRPVFMEEKIKAKLFGKYNAKANFGRHCGCAYLYSSLRR